MINVEKLKPVLDGYKTYFPTHWIDEKYKWEAIKHLKCRPYSLPRRTVDITGRRSRLSGGGGATCPD